MTEVLASGATNYTAITIALGIPVAVSRQFLTSHTG